MRLRGQDFERRDGEWPGRKLGKTTLPSSKPRRAALKRWCPPSSAPRLSAARPASAAWCTRAEWPPEAVLPGRGWGGAEGRAR